MWRVCLALFVAIAAPCLGASTPEVRASLALYEQELDVVDLLLDLNEKHRPADFDLVNVRVVDVEAGTVGAPGCVAVRRGLVAALADTCAPPAGIARIDGEGRWLAPGLADMHVHQLETAAMHVLNVAHGVTTVRDMTGFDWLLAWRGQAARNELFAPSMIVAGHILNGAPLGMYGTVVTTPEAAVAEVRRPAAAGYDAIKVHNVMRPEVYAAILDEARRLGIDVVGHVPHEISVAAAAAAGQRTLEHLKGYIDDRTLTISPDDWIAPTRNGTFWITPTLYAREHIRGDEARQVLASPAARYVPLLRQRRWAALIDQPVPAAHRELPAKQLEVLRKLLPATRRILAGTDSGGGYPFMVPGFALHDEMRRLQQAGMKPLEVLRAATVHGAEATRQQGRFGVIAVGARADLLLLDADPTTDASHLAAIRSVALRGAWLDRAALDRMLERLAAIAGRVPEVAEKESALDLAYATRLAERVERQRRAGFIHPAHHLQGLAAVLDKAGFAEAARRVSPETAP